MRIELISRHTSLLGLLEQNLFDILGVQVGLGVLSRILGGLDSSLLPQFGFDVLTMLGRHCAEAEGWRGETDGGREISSRLLRDSQGAQSGGVRWDPEALVYVVTEVERGEDRERSGRVRERKIGEKREKKRRKRLGDGTSEERQKRRLVLRPPQRGRAD